MAHSADIERRRQCNERILAIHRRYGAVIERRMSRVRTRQEANNLLHGVCVDAEKWTERHIRSPFWPA